MKSILRRIAMVALLAVLATLVALAVLLIKIVTGPPIQTTAPTPPEEFMQLLPGISHICPAIADVPDAVEAGFYQVTMGHQHIQHAELQWTGAALLPTPSDNLLDIDVSNTQGTIMCEYSVREHGGEAFNVTLKLGSDYQALLATETVDRHWKSGAPNTDHSAPHNGPRVRPSHCKESRAKCSFLIATIVQRQQ